MQARVTRAEHFNGSGINLSRHLTDGLVGDGRGSANPPRLPLKAGVWAFVYWDGGIYAGQGAFNSNLSQPVMLTSVLS